MWREWVDAMSVAYIYVIGDPRCDIVVHALNKLYGCPVRGTRVRCDMRMTAWLDASEVGFVLTKYDARVAPPVGWSAWWLGSFTDEIAGDPPVPTGLVQLSAPRDLDSQLKLAGNRLTGEEITLLESSKAVANMEILDARK